MSARDGLNRRGFLHAATAGIAAAAAGSAWADAQEAQAPPPPAKNDDLNLAFVGVGTQGDVLLVENCLKMNDQRLRIRAICDIWPYKRKANVGRCKAYRHDARGYEDYREMLAQEKDLDAVIIATPDWMHAEIAVACLQAGRHVYCEKEMSNTIEGARSMVQAARKSGKRLQIGHQRRSNPRYLTALEFVRKHRPLGRITNAYGQWNRFRGLRMRMPAASAMMDAQTLARYGYPSMEHFMNWRWYRRYSGGPIADLGSHQVDVFNWFLDAPPRAVVAMAYRDEGQSTEWYTSLNAIYEWQTRQDGRPQVVHGFYQLLNNSSHGGYFETLIGDEGSMNLSEKDGRMGLRRETNIQPFTQYERDLDKWALANVTGFKTQLERAVQKIEVGMSDPTGRIFPLPFDPRDDKPVHWRHLENFFAAVRDPKNVKLNCPGEVGLHSAVSVLRANECVAKNCRIDFKPEEFVV